MASRQPARRTPRAATARKSTARPRKARSNSKAAAKQKRSPFPVAAAMGLATAAIAAIGYVLRRRGSSGDGSFGTGEHAAPDLALDAKPQARAPEAFRPDPTAPVPAGERDAFRPALGKPTLVNPDRPAEPRADAEGGSNLNPQGGRVTPAEQDDVLTGGTTLADRAHTGNL